MSALLLILSAQWLVGHSGLLRTLFWIKSTMKVLPLCFNVWLKCVVKRVDFWIKGKRDTEKERKPGSISCHHLLLACVTVAYHPTSLNLKVVLPKQANNVAKGCDGRIK